MKHLRRLIRQILLENASHFDKLAEMICTQDPTIINQALELAEAMGYVGSFEYVQEDWANGYGIEHHWTISGGYDPSFRQTLVQLGGSKPAFYLDFGHKFPTKTTMHWVLREEAK